MPETNAADASIWAEHGLPGLVILVLFILLGGVLWYVRGEFRFMRTEHREERGEWRESNEKVAGKLTEAFDKLTDELRHRDRN